MRHKPWSALLTVPAGRFRSLSRLARFCSGDLPESITYKRKFTGQDTTKHFLRSRVGRAHSCTLNKLRPLVHDCFKKSNNFINKPEEEQQSKHYCANLEENINIIPNKMLQICLPLMQRNAVLKLPREKSRTNMSSTYCSTAYF